MLLSHTGGVSVRGFTGYERGHSTPSLHQILAGEAPANSDAINVVGSLGRFDYSGGGIMVLQQLIVDVTGQSYDDAAKRRVLTPLGMSDSGFEQPPSENGASNFAHAHALDGRPVPGGYNIYPELAAAGLWTTASDLCRVMHAISTSLAGRPGALFPEPIARQMVTPVDGNAALGVFIGSDGAIVHGGRNRGFSALYKLALSKGRGVAVMTNRHDAEQARLELVERALAHELRDRRCRGLRNRRPLPHPTVNVPAAGSTVTVSPDLIAAVMSTSKRSISGRSAKAAPWAMIGLAKLRISAFGVRPLATMSRSIQADATPPLAMLRIRILPT
jgi:CubicO group peptidase (beta-lactamase class C family)